MKHLDVWKIYGAFSPCDLATANNLNAETLYKVANATYKFMKGQNRMNADRKTSFRHCDSAIEKNISIEGYL